MIKRITTQKIIDINPIRKIFQTIFSKSQQKEIETLLKMILVVIVKIF